MDPDIYNEIVENNRRAGLDFDETVVVKSAVEFYKKHRRVKVHHVLGVHGLKSRKEKL